MIVYIVRHAWAEEADDPRYPDDRERPLTADGKKRFREVAKLLAQRDFQPSLIATSPLVRCRQTADILSEVVAGSPEVVELPALAPGSDLAALITWTSEQTDGEIAWVGHAPDVSNLAAGLIGEGRSWIRFAKGAAAAIRFEGPCQRGQGELTWLVTAKVLGV